MSEQYYTSLPTSKSRPETINIVYKDKNFVFDSDSGVFSKSELDRGSKLLIDSLENIQGSVLDLGCGWGAISIITKALFPSADILGCDINERAVHLAKQNAVKNRADVSFVISDGFLNIDKSFDIILTNPPIRTGKQNVIRLLTESHERLKKGGMLYCVIGKKQGAKSYKAFLSSLFSKVDLVSRSSDFRVFKCIKEE